MAAIRIEDPWDLVGGQRFEVGAVYRGGGNGFTMGVEHLDGTAPFALRAMAGRGENKENGGPQGSSSPHFQNPPFPSVTKNSSAMAGDARAWNEDSRKAAKPQRDH